MNTTVNDSEVELPEIEGEIRTDDLSRQLYSTDASIYKVRPRLVFFPHTETDIEEITRWAQRNDLPLTPRGSGTSLSGQAIGEGAVVDFSRQLDGILSFNPDDRRVTVQPGVILDHLNEFLGERGYRFGPDVATSSRANMGGMIGNNSAGAHSIRYGHTSSHLRSVDCVLSNGERVRFEPVSRDEARRRAGGDTLEAQLYRDIPPLIEDHADLIRERYPDIGRNSTGYALDRFLDQLDNGIVDFTKLVCGSEGTLASVVQATLDVVPAPERKGALVYHADSVLEALRVNALMVERNPYAIELVDDTLLDLARDSLQTSRLLDWVQGEPSALLIIEQAQFPGSDSLEDQIDTTESFLRDRGYDGAITRCLTEEEVQNVWKVRKAGLPLLMGLPGNDKPTTFVEDTAVDPQRLAEYVEDFQELVESHGTRSAYYGHASVGCLHIRPLVNLKSADGVETMRELAEDAFDLVLEYNGVISGEHGVGRSRSEFLDEQYGPEIVELFEAIKGVFDPGNRLNPGNVVDPQPITENLRFGPDYDAQSFEPVGSFPQEEGFTEAVEICNGNGACRKEEDGIMCPSYMVTREEKHSTRGRANALRGLFDGDLDPEALTDGTMEEVMELCISCKGCKSECPTGVDMGPMKSEVLHRVHQEKGASLRDRFFASVGPMFRAMSGISGLLGGLQNVPGGEYLVKKFLNVAPERSLPSLSSNVFPFEEYPSTPEGLDNPVVLYVDSFNGYTEPEISRAAVSVLERLGYDPVVPRMPCCGRPMISKGFLDKAREQVRKNLEILGPLAGADLPIVGLEPSCVSALTDDFTRLEDGEVSETVSRQARLFTDFLADHPEEELRKALGGRRGNVLIHGHCHQESLYGLSAPEKLFGTLTEGSVRTLDSGCCGMAGSFGFEAEHYEHSVAMAERVLAPSVRDTDPDTTVVASGTSCRQQVEDLTDRTALHPAVYLERTATG